MKNNRNLFCENTGNGSILFRKLVMIAFLGVFFSCTQKNIDTSNPASIISSVTNKMEINLLSVAEKKYYNTDLYGMDKLQYVDIRVPFSIMDDYPTWTLEWYDAGFVEIYEVEVEIPGFLYAIFQLPSDPFLERILQIQERRTRRLDKILLENLFEYPYYVEIQKGNEVFDYITEDFDNLVNNSDMQDAYLLYSKNRDAFINDVITLQRWVDIQGWNQKEWSIDQWSDGRLFLRRGMGIRSEYIFGSGRFPPTDY